MPAEWAPHEATWLAWPRNAETWPGPRLEHAREAYLRMLEALLPGERVHLLVADASAAENVLGRLKRRGVQARNLILHEKPFTDSWIRDYGPSFVTKPAAKAWCKWTFNAWGGKYSNLSQDNLIFEDKSLVSDRVFETGIVLEGGSIEVNGEGTCLTTEQCLLQANRNPKLSREEIEAYLQAYLGVSQILWLGEGIAGDDTDGHIDDVARFCAPSTILAAFEEDPADENHAILKANWERLRGFRDPAGKPWKLVKFPMPGKYTEDGIRLPASYANFYIANQAVLLPVFKDAADLRAEAILKELFPRREVVAIDSRALVYGLGAIHCLTQQEPSISDLR